MNWPKCERCCGFGYEIHGYIPSGIIQEDDPVFKTGVSFMYDSAGNKIPCPACKDGERDLTADEAEKYLAESGYTFDYERGLNLVYISIKQVHINKEAVLLQVHAPTLTQALNAACRAVRSKG